MLDVVDIKSKVKNKEIEFYLLKDNIYCKDNNTLESVNVGNIYSQKNAEKYFTINLNQEVIEFILSDTWNNTKKLSAQELNELVNKYINDILKERIEGFNNSIIEDMHNEGSEDNGEITI